MRRTGQAWRSFHQIQRPSSPHTATTRRGTMKLAVLVMLLVPAVAFDLKKIVDDLGSGRRLKTGNQPTPSPPVTECKKIPITFYREDIATYYVENAIGGGLAAIPFYDTTSGDQLGTYSDATTQYDTECVATGAFSFDQGADNLYQSQINVAFTCNSDANAIVGGSGTYACASGYETFLDADDTVVSAQLTLCGASC